MNYQVKTSAKCRTAALGCPDMAGKYHKATKYVGKFLSSDFLKLFLQRSKVITLRICCISN
jgi:hypothetical protein